MTFSKPAGVYPLSSRHVSESTRKLCTVPEGMNTKLPGPAMRRSSFPVRNVTRRR